MSEQGNEREEVDARTALSRFLSTIKNQADVDPVFRNNLLIALGVTVVFDGEDDLSSIEPHVVATLKNREKFFAIYSKLTSAKLRSTLTKSKLASATDLRGQSQEQMLNMLWDRAKSRAEERGLTG